MIDAPAEALKDFITRWRDTAQISVLPSIRQQEFDDIISSVWSREFPGAILAWPRQNKPTVYYAIANNATEWRRLRPLLLAFAGPTLTSFTGRVEPLLPKIPIESMLITTGWAVVARMVVGSDQKAEEIAYRSLKRMFEMVSRAPATTRDAPQPTSQLLAQFVDALNGNDRLQATAILGICREELRLDALNLLFLKIQLLAHFGEWRSICAIREFNSLCHTRKPRTVAMAMLEALYQCHLGTLDPTSDSATELSIWRESIRPLALPLIRLPIPATATSGAVRLYGLAALTANPRQPALEAALTDFEPALGYIHAALLSAGRLPLDSIVVPTDRTAEEALISADDENTLSSIAAALEKFRELTPDERDRVLKSDTFRRILQGLRAETQGQTPPLGWSEWFKRLADPEFSNSLDILKHAIDEWPAQALLDPIEIAQLAEAITDVPDVAPAEERLADALPFLVAWVAKDLEFPRPGMLPIYDALLFHLVVGSRRVARTYESATILIRALFAIGLPAPRYRTLLEDCLALAGVGIGTRSIYWLLDILDETVINSAPDPDQRQAFWSAVHARLVPLRSHLTGGQGAALRRLAGMLGWAEPYLAEILPQQADQEALLRDALADRHVAIYSLTETAARQAKEVLEEIAPGVRVSLSHDTVGNNALRAMAQNADFFVIVTASAKHAATGFIQEWRPPGKPILFAAGRGFTSIIRAVEDFVLPCA